MGFLFEMVTAASLSVSFYFPGIFLWFLRDTSVAPGSSDLTTVIYLWGQVLALTLPNWKSWKRSWTLSFSLSLFKNIYLFIWLRQVLVVARGIFVAACGIFVAACGIFVAVCGIFSCGIWDLLVAACGIFSCGMRTLSCGMWDLVPWPGIEPRPPALGVQSLSHWIARKVLIMDSLDS